MRPSVCRSCRRPSETAICSDCVRTERPRFALGCWYCGEEFISRNEEHRYCPECWRISHPIEAAIFLPAESEVYDENPGAMM